MKKTRKSLRRISKEFEDENINVSSFYFPINMGFEYTSGHKKSGEEIIFCKLDNLLLDYYQASSMLEVHPHLNTSGEYSIQCPFCKEEGYLKEKLYITEDFTLGHCFKCRRAFINITDDITYNIKTPRLYGSCSSFNLVKLTDKTFSLDMYYNEFDDYDDIGYNYLINKRHKFMDPLYKLLKFKFWNHNVVMPFMYHGEIFYYQIRFTGKSRIKYFFPKISHKPPYIIENGDCKKFIICEGVYDAIALLILYPDRTPFAVLGSSISDYQIEFLREYVPSDILIYMDETSISNSIRRKLQTVIDYCPIHVKRSKGQDPEEFLKYLINKGVY